MSDELTRQRGLDLEGCLELQGAADIGLKIGAAGFYTNGADGKPIWNTNTNLFWHGVWKEDTNGWRVELNFLNTNTTDVQVAVSVGSIAKNSDDGTGDYFKPPDNRFEKFELLDSNGIAVPPKWGETSLQKAWPQRIAVRLYPGMEVGPLAGEFWFVSNGPPFCLTRYQLNNDFLITNEGDYTLTIQPVLYQNRTGKKIDVSGGAAHFHQTNTNYFDRVDLPSVTTKVHLKPSQ